MALDIITGALVAPRGGVAGTPVTVTGAGFGVVQGRVIFDPLNAVVDAAISLWQDDQITFVVPALAIDNQFTRAVIERSDLSDTETFPFWLPDAAEPVNRSLPAGLDYQWPFFEEGLDESVDDPRTTSAADFNRLLGSYRALPAASTDTWVEPVFCIRYIGNDTVTNLDTTGAGLSVADAGKSFVVTDAGTLTLGGVSVTAGDVVEWTGASWVLVLDSTTGFPAVLTRMVVSTFVGDTLQAPLTGGADNGRIAQFDGASLTPATFITPADGWATLVRGEGSPFENTGWTFDGAVPAGLWTQFTGAVVLSVPRQETLATQTVTGADVVLTATLSFVPISSVTVNLYLNGVHQVQGVDYTIVGVTITWLAGSGTAADMDTNDVLAATYDSV